MDSNYNIEITNWIYHALCNHDKELVIKSYVNRDTKYLDKIEFRLYMDCHSECPFASIFVEIGYSHRWGGSTESLEIYGKISGLEKENSNMLKLLINDKFDNLPIKYKELNPIIRTITTIPPIHLGHHTSSVSEGMVVGTRVEIIFEIEKPYLREDLKLELDKKTILCLDALKDVSHQLKSIEHQHCCDPEHTSENNYF